MGISLGVWRSLPAAVCTVLLWSALSPARAEDPGTLVVSSFGGRFQDAERKAFFQPFEKATGIKVIETSGIALPKIEAMVTTQNVEADVIDTAPSEFLVLANKGYLEKIDYSVMDKKVKDELLPQAIHPFGVGIIFYAQVIGYNLKAYTKEHHPHSWAEVWDTTKFPGPRVIASGTYAVPPVEIALLADGVSPDKLYPLDLERAYRSLTKIRPAVIKWSDAAPVALQALVDGEASIAQVSQGRLAELMAQGAPVAYDWNEAILELDYWAVPKGAKNAKNAMKFIAFASGAEQQAELARQLPFGPSNRRALDLLPEKIRKDLPSAPENLKTAIFVNSEAWAGKTPDGPSSYVERNLEMWNAWITQ